MCIDGCGVYGGVVHRQWGVLNTYMCMLDVLMIDGMCVRGGVSVVCGGEDVYW